MRQQITRLGFVFTITIVLVGLAAFGSGNNLLFLMFAALLATLLISGLVSRLGLAGLELHLMVPEHVAARRAVHARLIVKNRKWLVPSFSLHLSGAAGSGLRQELYIPVISGGTTLDEPVELFFSHRGLYKENTFAFASRFPFGFTHRRAQVRLEQEVLVYPSIDPQPGFEGMLADIAGDIESRHRGRGTDFYLIRPYIALESARHVDWRATAHTGELQLREFAREDEDAVTIFLDIDVPPGHHRWFERAVEGCAFLAWRLNERGIRLHFVAHRYDRRVPEEATVYDILKFLALVEPSSGAKPSFGDERNLQIAITAHPESLPDLGHTNIHVLSLDDFPDGTGTAEAGATADTHVDNRDGAARN